jgi:hypothetical protein
MHSSVFVSQYEGVVTSVLADYFAIFYRSSYFGRPNPSNVDKKARIVEKRFVATGIQPDVGSKCSVGSVGGQAVANFNGCCPGKKAGVEPERR